MSGFFSILIFSVMRNVFKLSMKFMALSEGVYLGGFMIIIVVIVILWFEMSLEGLC